MTPGLRAQLRLYLVTDPQMCHRIGLVETVRQAVAGGVSMVQLRDKTATPMERIGLARALKKALAGTGVPLIVNDDIDAAIEAGADGAHIGQGDMDPKKARARLGQGKILGLSCETPQTVRAADSKIVDYLGLGPVFGTATKSDHAQPIGLSGLADLVALTTLPTVAIGGLNAGHVDGVCTTGADGLAVVSAICGHPDVRAAARAFDLTSREVSP